MALAAVRSKVLVLLLFIHCFVGRGLCLVLVLLCSIECRLMFCNHLARTERAGCNTLQ